MSPKIRLPTFVLFFAFFGIFRQINKNEKRNRNKKRTNNLVNTRTQRARSAEGRLWQIRWQQKKKKEMKWLFDEITQKKNEIGPFDLFVKSSWFLPSMPLRATKPQHSRTFTPCTANSCAVSEHFDLWVISLLDANCISCSVTLQWFICWNANGSEQIEMWTEKRSVGRIRLIPLDNRAVTDWFMSEN